MTYQLGHQSPVNVEQHCRRGCPVRWCQLRVSTCQQQSSRKNPSLYWDLIDSSQATTGATASASALRVEAPKLCFKP